MKLLLHFDTHGWNADWNPFTTLSQLYSEGSVVRHLLSVPLLDHDIDTNSRVQVIHLHHIASWFFTDPLSNDIFYSSSFCVQLQLGPVSPRQSDCLSP